MSVEDDGCPSMEPSLHLQLPDLSEDQLQELAYTLFCTYCNAHASPSIRLLVRQQLEMSSARSGEVESALLAVLDGSQLRQPAASLQLPVRLLHAARPGSFPSFRAFRRWQGATCAALSATLVWSALQHRLDQADSRWGLAHARFKGAMRRLAVPCADEYDEEEYTEAIEAFFLATKQFSAHSRLRWRLPWGVRLRAAQLLLAAVLAARASGKEGTPLADGPELEQLLAERLWPALGISGAVQDALQPFLLFQAYCATGDAALLERTKQLLPRLVIHGGANGASANGGDAALDATEDEAAVTDLVLESITGHVAGLLRDFTAACSGARVRLMRGMLEVLRVAQQCRPSAQSSAQMVEDCIRCSMEAAYARLQLAAEAAEAPKEERLMALARGVNGLLDEVEGTFAPALSAYVLDAAGVAAASLNRLFGAALRPWMSTGVKLDPRSVTLIRTLLDLEERLSAYSSEDGVQGWGLMAAVEPVLYEWASVQLGLLGSWLGRLLPAETWAPITQPQGCSRSCVELLKMANEAVDALFAMGLPVPLGVVRSLVEGIDGILQRYVEGLMAAVGSPDALRPPLPPLARYKRDVALRLQSQDSGVGNSRPATLPHANGRAAPKEGSEASFSGRPGSGGGHWAAAAAAAAALPLDALTCRLTSLDYLLARLPVLSATLLEKYDECAPESPAQHASRPWLEGIFEGAQAAIQQASRRLTAFIAAKVVYGNLRAPLLEEVYRHAVERARLGPVLTQLDDALGALCAATPRQLHPGLARALLQATVDALQRVLLHGGACRWFITDDVDMLEDDLAQLQALFEAEGDGLSRGDIQEICSPLVGVLVTMQLDTGILIANYKQAKQDERQAQAGGNAAPRPPQGAAYDQGVIIAVLAHRADRSASKFLKKELNLPKSADASPKPLAGLTSGFNRLTSKMRNAL